jgi:hypothetical protein
MITVKNHYSRDEFMGLWRDVFYGIKSRFPEEIWQNPKNRELATSCLIEKKIQEHYDMHGFNRILGFPIQFFKFPTSKEIEEQKLKGLFSSAFIQNSLFKLFSEYGLFDICSENYDPYATTLPHLAFESQTLRYTEDRFIEYLIGEISELSIVAGVEGSVSENISQNYFPALAHIHNKTKPTDDIIIDRSIDFINDLSLREDTSSITLNVDSEDDLENYYLIKPEELSNLTKKTEGYGMNFKKEVLLYGVDIKDRINGPWKWSPKKVLDEAIIFVKEHSHISKGSLVKAGKGDLANAISKIGIPNGKGYRFLKEFLYENNHLN